MECMLLNLGHNFYFMKADGQSYFIQKHKLKLVNFSISKSANLKTKILFNIYFQIF